MTQRPLKAPFPYVGGKSAVADRVWARLGDVQNFAEPFAGSLAVLLRRPEWHSRDVKRETVSDVNHYLVNFWRSVTADPDAVAEHADHPVIEADLHARHRWLVLSAASEEHRRRIVEDADYYDVRMAGWWVWGQSCWIGGGWCSRRGKTKDSVTEKVPELTDGRGVNVAASRVTDPGRRPSLSAIAGVNSGRPQLGDAYDLGRGVHSHGEIGDCAARRSFLVDWMRRLSDRLRQVRVCYGHWLRICNSETATTRLGLTGVFLDPPYPTHQPDGTVSRGGSLYHGDDRTTLDELRDEVLDWCRRCGPNPLMRIAVCGYDTDGYAALENEGWTVEAWKAQGGYGNRKVSTGKENTNRGRERIWFSPSCLLDGGLFD